MKVLVTGADGFVGRWLARELAAAGHQFVAAPSQQELDLAAPDAASRLAEVAASVRPAAVVHLAAVSFAPDADRDPSRAIAVNAQGTAALFEALDVAASDAGVLVVSSSEVYGKPERLPVSEGAELLADGAYGRSKIAEEEAAFAAADRSGRRLVVVRAFNHLGPGQRDSFAAPAFAQRVLAVKRGEASDISVGNVDVRRDFTDVRDVVHAYRLLVEALVRGEIRHSPPVVNVGSGRSVAIRELLEILCHLAGVPAELRVDPALVRENEAPEIRADVSRVRQLVGWRPTIPLERSLADLLASLAPAAPATN